MNIINESYALDILGKYVSLEKSTSAPDGTKNAADSELREINRELSNTGRYLKHLYEHLVMELLTPDEYTQMKSDYEAKIEALSRRADEVRAQSRKLDEEKSEYSGFADAVSAAIRKNELTAEIADALIEKISVSQDKSFEVFYRFNTELGEVG
jgi:cell division protein FtsB